MASTADLRALEALTPWPRPEFVAGLAALQGSAEQAARQYAADARVPAGLVALVPRCAHDDRGGIPWTSFQREVSLARKVSDRAAATLIRTAVALTRCLPQTLALLAAGRTTVERASAFARELEPYDDTLAGQVDATLAARAAQLPPWRIVQEARRPSTSSTPKPASSGSRSRTPPAA